MQSVQTLPLEQSLNQQRSNSLLLGIPAFVYATVFSSLCIVVGLIWDISWHMTIGRDGLLSPPHLGIYLGAIVSGLFSGYQVLKTTIVGSPEEKAKNVKFWGVFYGSLGALFCIWGAIAMLTSAPFDDWWHNTYGLDVKILSPPHTVLALGMMMIQFGAMIAAVAIQNRPHEGMGSPELEKRRETTLKWLYAIASGLLLITIFTLASEYLGPHDMHHSLFYQVGGFVFPLFLVAVGTASQLKWGATTAAFFYMIVMAAMVWILPLFPAEPLLGPILNHVDHYQPFEFPLLLVFPALGIDLAKQRLKSQNKWIKAAAYGAVFLTIFFIVQWPFGDFLMSEPARGWFFGSYSWYFGSNPDWEYRYAFMPWHLHTGWALVKGLAIALLISIVSSRIGLAWGGWMKRIQR